MSSFDTGSSFNYYNPERFFPFVAISSNISTTLITAASGMNSAQGFTNLAANGVAVDSNFTAGAAKQILSVSGPGEMYGVIGPTAGGAETTQFTVVVDGLTYTSPAFAVTSGDRAGLWFALTYGAVYTTASGSSSLMTLDATKTISNTTTIALPLGMTPVSSSTPKLQFDTSLVVSVTHSANVTGTANQERQSGVGYRKFATWT